MKKLTHTAIQHQKCYNFYFDYFFIQALLIFDRTHSAHRALYQKERGDR